MRRFAGVGATFLLLSLAAGCKDSGLPGKNLPLAAAARNQTWGYPTYEPSPARVVGGERIVTASDRKWLVMEPTERIPADRLREVATVGGTGIYALSWDVAPYDRLYAPEGGDRWLRLRSIP